MNAIDLKKNELIVLDSIQRLTFLSFVGTQNEISSELAGYEINKLLEQ